MNDYNEYTNEVNKIFNILDSIEKNWINEDSNNYIDNIKNYKSTIINFANIIKEKNIQSENGEMN